ncbi:redoxin domain-containing protein [Maribacter sp. X9]|uniref:redoxin domain-containing protein n=1 Tax=Maribacter sp. X9 TaxID=3402159 RepID=UPI003AF3DC4D
MKKHFGLIFLSSLILGCSDKGLKEGEYSIKGEVPKSLGVDRAIMSYPPDDSGGAYRSDTTAIVNGKFEFKGAIGRPQLAELNIIKGQDKLSDTVEIVDDGPSMKNVALFYLEGRLDITFDSSGMATYAGGGEEQKSWLEWQVMSQAMADSLNGESTLEGIQHLVGRFVHKYPDRYAAVDLMDIVTQGPIQYDLVGPMYDDLSERMKSSSKVLSWKPELDKAKAYETGEIVAQGFTMDDPNGDPVSLDSYKGKYVLLDFWASWCAPCRAENPNVLAAYEKFRDDDFTILAVSIDTDREAWLKAIKEDGLPWTHISDLKGSDNRAAKAYGVNAIPDNFLINPEGKIVGRGLRGKALHDKLQQLIK